MAFNDFNKDFFNRTSEVIDQFQVGDFSYYKVIQDVLLRKVKPQKKGISDKLNIPFWLNKFIFSIKGKLKSKKVQQYSSFQNSKTLLISNLRELNGKHIYLERIVPLLKENNPIVVCTSDSNNHLVDIKMSELKADLKPFIFTPEAKVLYNDLIKLKKQLESLKIFTSNEWKSIRIGLSDYWINTSIWMTFIQLGAYKNIFLIPGYQTEDIIQAAKQTKTKLIELQHGIISKSSRFYLYPSFMKPFKHHALFPDYIYVFGKYWKDKLLSGNEFEEHQIKIVGDYFYREKKEIKLKDKYVSKNIIVIATQQTVKSSLQLKYLKFLKNKLKENHPNWLIIHKPHPAEEIDLYKNIYDDYLILGEHQLQQIMPHADIFISFYSTSLYEFSRYNRPAYALYLKEYKEFINDVIESGVADKLKPNEVPKLERKLSAKENSKYYFDDFNKELIYCNNSEN